MKFKYTAKKGTKTIVNIIEGETREDVYMELRSRGVFPITLQPYRDNFTFLKRKLPNKEMVFFFENMCTLLHSGIPISDAFEIGIDQIRHKRFKKLLEEVYVEVSKGFSLSEVMKERKEFPPLVSAILKIGEESGTLTTSLKHLGTFYANQDKVSQKIKGAIAYPFFTLFVALGIAYYISVGVLPKIMFLIQESTNMNIFTRILIASSEFFGKYKLLPIIGLAWIVLGAVVLTQTVFKKQADYLILQIPFIGTLLKRNMVVQFITTFIILHSAEMPLVNIIDVIKDLLLNEAFRENLEKIQTGVVRGESISEQLSPQLFDRAIISIFRVGETTGEMIEPLRNAAAYVNGELESSVKRLTDMIMPFSILILGLLVMVLILGIMAPIFSMYQNMNG